MYTQYPQYPAAASQSRDDKLSKTVKDPLLGVVRWLKRRNPTEKLVLLGITAIVVRAPPPPPQLPEYSPILPYCRCLSIAYFRENILKPVDNVCENKIFHALLLREARWVAMQTFILASTTPIN